MASRSGAAAPAQTSSVRSRSSLRHDRSSRLEYAHDPALSGDGRYVVFDGSVAGVTGVWRRENRPAGAVEQVAGGDAELPSISADGRYVSFTTNRGRISPNSPTAANIPKNRRTKARASTCATWKRRGRARGVHAGLGAERIHPEPQLRIPRRPVGRTRTTGIRLGRRGPLRDQRRRTQGRVRDDRGLEPRRARDAAAAGGRAGPRQRRNAARQRSP